MILGISGTILKIMLVIILIGIMVMVLMGINYAILRQSKQLREDNERRLREEVEHSQRVISPESVFHDFLARDMRAARVRTSRRHRKHSHTSV